jgi:hypothetical protein
MMQDFTAAQVKIEEAIKHLDLRDLLSVDEALFSLQG